MRSSVIGSRGGSAKSLGSIRRSSSNLSTSFLSLSETSTISPISVSKKNFFRSLEASCEEKQARRSVLNQTLRFVQSIPGRLVLALIAFYKLILSPLLSPACRFEPTCSSYATESIRRFGLLHGGWYATKRICRCHPFSKHSGLDPVPSLRNTSLSKESE